MEINNSLNKEFAFLHDSFFDNKLYIPLGEEKTAHGQIIWMLSWCQLKEGILGNEIVQKWSQISFSPQTKVIS